MPRKPSNDITQIVKAKAKKSTPKANVSTKPEAAPKIRLPKGTPDNVRDIVKKYLEPAPKKVNRADVLKDIQSIVKAFAKKTPGQAKAKVPPAPKPTTRPKVAPPPVAPEPPKPAPAKPSDDVRAIVKAKTKKAATMHAAPPKTKPKPKAAPAPPTTPAPSPAADIAKAKTKKTSVPNLHPRIYPTEDRPLTFFDKVKNRMRREGIPLLTKKARAWMKQTLTSMRTPSRKGIVNNGETLTDVLIGNMFFFFYDAKHKKTLPYWDRFPLIFPLELYDDGFLGLNLHYLDRNLRVRLFDKLLQFKNNDRYDDTTKLKLSYALLASVAKFPEVRPCVKRYLSSHVRSQFVRVHPSEWEIALFLPVEMFQKQSADYVWAESRRKIRSFAKRKKK